MSRPLEIRLQEYIRHGRSTSKQILDVCERMETQFPGESMTSELRATATVQGIVCDDLEKMLNGEELVGWKIEGVMPNG